MSAKAEITIFICGSKKTSVAKCASGCGNATNAYCQFALGGKHAGKKCSRGICESCANGGTLCPPHKRLTDKRTSLHG